MEPDADQSRDYNEKMFPVVVRYREYAPCAALRESVRALFSFAEPTTDDVPSRRILCEIPFRPGASFCSPMFADGHASLVFSFPRVCRADGLWQSGPVVPRDVRQHAKGAVCLFAE